MYVTLDIIAEVHLNNRNIAIAVTTEKILSVVKRNASIMSRCYLILIVIVITMELELATAKVIN